MAHASLQLEILHAKFTVKKVTILFLMAAISVVIILRNSILRGFDHVMRCARLGFRLHNLPRSPF